MCEIGERIWQKGFCAGNEGNHSARLGGPGDNSRFLCTPTGISKGMLDPEDLIVCNGEGEQIEPNNRGRRPTSEIKVHLAIYKKRPDVGAVIHSHPPHATAFAIAGIPVPEGIHPEAEVFLGKVKTAPFAMPSTHDLPESLMPLIDDQTNTLLMGNHGSVSFADTLIDTYYKLEILDAYCRTLLLVKQLGRVNVLSPDQMQGLLKVKQQFGMEDPRLTCAPDGCIGSENEQFLATFGDRPASAVSFNGDGRVGPPAPGSDNGVTQGFADGDPAFEHLVSAITDQIMREAA
jgi:L-fuculose-phosphate aldolase